MAMSPIVGIDFGTTYCKMAWYNPRTRQAEPIRNNEQREQTPSVVYFGENETRVGDPAVDMLEDEQERENVIISAKRQLVNTPLLAIPGGSVNTIDIVATILHKLKEDAERSPLLQGQEVTRAVITYPASFDHIYRDKLREAGRGRIAGFQEIELLDEPTAAALAYAHMGPKVGNHVLVYDLGGGTFDLALLAREDNDTFRLAMDPQGMERCGGDDFDEALYNKCDDIAKEKLGRSISLTGERDLNFLNECRHWKERLSNQGRRAIKYLLEPGPVPFQYEIDRATFENLIRANIEETVRRTEEILKQAEADGYSVDTLVLVGGSTNIPLVRRLLTERLHLKPLVWHYQDIAVALGAAYYAYSLWGSENQYRKALIAAWVNQRLDESKIAELTNLANRLELDENQITELERTVMGETKVKIFARQVAKDEYRTALQKAWDNKKLDEPKIQELIDLAKQLVLTNKQVVDLECEVMGGDKESILARQHAQEQYREAVKAAWADRTIDATKVERLADLAHSLDLSEDQLKEIECEEMGGTKETIFAQQRALAQYHEAVKAAWADRTIDEAKIEQLTSLAHSLDLSEDQLKEIECEEMGGTKETIFAQQQAFAQYREAVNEVWADGMLDRRKIAMLYAVANKLSLSDEQIDSIEFELMNDIKERIFVNQYKPRVITRAVQRVDTVSHFLSPLAIEKLALLRTLTGHTYLVFSVAISADGQTLVSGSYDKSIKVWNLSTGKEVRTLTGHTSDVWSVAISADGQTLVSGSADKTIKVWSLSTGQEVRTFKGHKSYVKSVALSADGQTLASGSWDGTIKVWNLSTGQAVRTLTGHTDVVTSVAISADGQTLASGSNDRTIKVWGV